VPCGAGGCATVPDAVRSRQRLSRRPVSPSPFSIGSVVEVVQRQYPSPRKMLFVRGCQIGPRLNDWRSVGVGYLGKVANLGRLSPDKVLSLDKNILLGSSLGIEYSTVSKDDGYFWKNCPRITDICKARHLLCFSKLLTNSWNRTRSRPQAYLPDKPRWASNQ